MDVTTLVVSAAMRCVWSTLVGLALEMQPTHKHARVSMAMLVDRSFRVPAPHKDARVSMVIRYGLRWWVAGADDP